MFSQTRSASAAQAAQHRLTQLFAADPAPVATALIDLPALSAQQPSARQPSALQPSALPGPGAFDPGRRGVKALAVLAAVVVAVAAYFAWQSRPRPEPVPPVEASVVEQDPIASSPSPTELVVAVTGKVRRPGLVRLPEGSRVADAIEAAGGPLPGVDLSAVNLARKLTDGELIAIGVPGVPDGGGTGDAGGVGKGGGGKVNLNTATLAQLDGLPGVGPVLAQRIVDYRAAHGAFRGVGELRQVEGIGDAKYEQLKDLVTV